MAMNDAVDWARDLGGGVRVALIQAGTFRSDAGTLFGPVPWVLWGGIVEDEVDDKRRLLQALNCLLIETRSGRVLVETGIGDRVDEKTRAIRAYEGPWIVPALEAAGFPPESVNVVVSGGASVDNFHRTFGSLRIRYFGPRPLIEDNSVRSKATTLLNAEGGYQLAKALRLNLQVYNLLDAEVSDIDYYFASRLPGEPLGGVEDIHVHPAVPRTLRLSMILGF